MISQVIISVILAYLLAHIYKFIDNYRNSGKFEFSTVLQNGGMPSSHTSTTVALTTSLFIETGLSYFTVMAGMFTIIVMNDAVKVRREVGEEAKVLNQVINKENLTKRRLVEMVGHTPIQVGFGFLLGIFITLIVYSF